MPRELILDRPLAIFDIEATGTHPQQDRIVDLAVTWLHPGKKAHTSRSWRVNPVIPIPPEATRIHGIRNEDVSGCPRFCDIAAEVASALDGCDLGGFNLIRFDIPMLAEEFRRSNVFFDVSGRRIVDAQRIFHMKEPRDLTAALAFYCGEFHLNAHGAQADVDATVRVIEAQLKRYTDLPLDMDNLNQLCNPRDPSWVDQSGRLRWSNGEIVLNFGKKKGTSLRALISEDRSFIKWMLRSDFPGDVKTVIEDAIDGRWPSPPKAPVAADAAENGAQER